MGETATKNGKILTAAYYTLGCKLNFAETSTIGDSLRKVGIADAPVGTAPDVCVINTCSVTEMADKKARNLIRRVVKDFPGAVIVVTGCYAQLKPMEVASIEGVDLIFGSNEKPKIAAHLQRFFSDHPAASAASGRKAEGPAIETSDLKGSAEFTPSCSRGDRTRFFLKVQDGCDYFCTYCTIPFARGRSRSGRIDQIVAQAREAAADGGKEIVLTGVNIGDFGKNTGESFFSLLRRLDETPGIRRIRISSIEPNLLTDEIIGWIATESKLFMPHFHIPLQSGSDAVLKLMNRRYDTALFAEKIRRIKEAIPDAFIGVDVIAGARGETQAEWEASRRFIESLPVSRLHVFPYSERPGTAALLLADPVEKAERNRRTAELIAISDGKLADYMRSNAGQRRDVLWEQPVRGTSLMSGLTDNYIRVVAPLREELLNEISTVEIGDIDPKRSETMTAAHI
ncbi:MAG: tRNA (N(6)-L-threonylcarbamoyladenosine(37)-C(2))-methylthiotransferase MtaB [Muribaculaceae bacterium]|nr:tRNA (N(6)-L-threonylcarbamoyladenosine(37)-C(2))-methylthiotransferase MtaB [Muribaculaceae bacterium]